MKKALIIIIIAIILVIFFLIFKSQNIDLGLSGLTGEESRESLFEVRVEIPEEYLTVKPGEVMLATIEIFNLGAPRGIDLQIDYEIRDLKEKAIPLGSETIGIETRVGIIKTFKLPSDIKDGTYLFYAKITYKEDIIGTSASFEVSREPLFNPAYKTGVYRTSTIIVISVIILIIILIFIFSIIFLRHLHKEHANLLKEEKKMRAEHRKIVKEKGEKKDEK